MGGIRCSSCSSVDLAHRSCPPGDPVRPLSLFPFRLVLCPLAPFPRFLFFSPPLARPILSASSRRLAQLTSLPRRNSRDDLFVSSRATAPRPSFRRDKPAGWRHLPALLSPVWGPLHTFGGRDLTVAEAKGVPTLLLRLLKGRGCESMLLTDVLLFLCAPSLPFCYACASSPLNAPPTLPMPCNETESEPSPPFSACRQSRHDC